MNYRRLGKTGLKVSELSYGSWVTFSFQIGQKKVTEMLKLAYDNGINFFDNAEAYASGESERLMGKSIKDLGWGRDTYIVKFFGVGKNQLKMVSVISILLMLVMLH
jgi:aryl-alcohol dehydrogenase-like predicted oxidoreductase